MQDMTRSAFTLIELLVVIAIIAVLAALAFPLVEKMRERGLQAKCAGNLKAIAAAWSSYIADNAGRLPPAKTGQGPWHQDYWTKSLWPYLGFSNVPSGHKAQMVGTVAYCPANKGDPYHSKEYSVLSYIPNAMIGGAFLSNGQLDSQLTTQNPNFKTPVARTVGAIADPSGTFLFVSAKENMIRTFISAWNPLPFMATHFGGKGNALFADGHVELIDPQAPGVQGRFLNQ